MEKEFDSIIPTVLQLLKSDKKIEATKLVMENSTMNLKTSKEFVDILSKTNLTERDFLETMFDKKFRKVSSSGKLYRKGNEIIAQFTNNLGETKTITPQSPEWIDFKKLMKNNEMILEYENTYTKNATHDVEAKSTSKKSSVFIEEKSSSKWKKIILFFIVAAIAYYFFSRA